MVERSIPLAVVAAVALGLAPRAHAQTLSVPVDSPRWELEGQTRPAEYLGRRSLLVEGGAAVVKDFGMRDA
jgi:hypothetical protein